MLKLVANNGLIKRTRRLPHKWRVIEGNPTFASIKRADEGIKAHLQWCKRQAEIEAAVVAFARAHNDEVKETAEIAAILSAMYAEESKR